MLVEELREAEVEHLDVAVAPDHHVLRLDVAVDDPGVVRGGQRGGHLRRDPDAFAGRHCAAARIRCRSVSPSTNSLTMNGRASRVPNS